MLLSLETSMTLFKLDTKIHTIFHNRYSNKSRIKNFQATYEPSDLDIPIISSTPTIFQGSFLKEFCLLYLPKFRMQDAANYTIDVRPYKTYQ